MIVLIWNSKRSTRNFLEVINYFSKVLGYRNNTPKPIVAVIVEVNNHPTRDDLHVLTVNTGKENVQIVCGAPNVYVGLRGVLAPVGAKLPTMKKPLTERAVAGVKSFGMMCSAAELGQGDEGDNIIELGTDSEIGDEYK